MDRTQSSREPEATSVGGHGDDQKSGQHEVFKGQRNEDLQASEMTLLQTTQSVLWAMLGVQSKRNARRDFSKGKFAHFVIIGIGFALVFILTLVSLIQLVLPES